MRCARHRARTVVLLQEGTNDVSLNAEIPDIIKGLRDMVREAKFRGVQPFVGALLPG
jgi:lysophospholipase L1-like esterase